MAGMWSFRLNFVKNACLNYSRNLVSFNFRGDNARVFQRVSIRVNLNMTVGQAACQLLCRYTYSTLAAFAESYRLRRVALSKELVAVHLWNAPDQWHNWRTALPVKLNVKTGPLRSLYFGIYYSFGFSRLLFFLRFSECFPVISGFCIDIQYRVYYCFSIIFWVLASGLPSAKFHHGSNL